MKQIWNGTTPLYLGNGAKIESKEQLGNYSADGKSKPFAFALTPAPIVVETDEYGVASEISPFTAYKNTAVSMGIDVTDLTPSEVLTAIEEKRAEEEAKAEAKANEPTAEERIASQLEFQSMMMD